MKTLKRAVTLLLALLMLTGGVQFAYAEEEYVLSLKTELGKYVGDEFVVTNTANPGDEITARVYLGTEFDVSDIELLFFYDKNFYSVDYTDGADGRIATCSSYTSYYDYSFSMIQANNDLKTTSLISYNVITKEQSNRFGWIFASFSTKYGSSDHNLDFSKPFVEFKLNIRNDAQGTGWFKFVSGTAINSARTFFNLYDIDYLPISLTSVSADDVNNCISITPAAMPESLSVTFNAGKGTIGTEGKNTLTETVSYGAKVIPPEVASPENTTLKGWYIDGDKSQKIVDPDEICITSPVTYVAVYECIKHTPKDIVIENKVESSCTKKGSYDEVVYCEICNNEISRETKSTDMKPHTPKAAVKENEVSASCTKKGSYDEVVYCEICNNEITRETKSIDMKPHNPDNAVKENEVSPTYTANGHYDMVVYCVDCKVELSRETVNTNKKDCNVMPDSFGNQSAPYGTYVTANVKINNVPDDAEVWIAGSKAEGKGTYTKYLGQMKNGNTFKVEIKSGGTVIEESSITVEVSRNIFRIIISWFVNWLFNLFKWKSVPVNF